MFPQDDDRRGLLADLAETNRLLKLAEQIAHVGHWRLYFATGERQWSDETYRIFGQDPTMPVPAVTANWNGYLESDWALVRSTLRSAIDNQQDFTVEARVIRPNGEIRNVEIRGIYDLANGGKSLFGVIIDLTDQKQAEARYRLLADHTTDMIVHADRHSKRLYVSPSSRDLLGFEPDDLVGRQVGGLLHPADEQAHRDITQGLERGEIEHAANRQRFTRKDGTHVWTESRFRILRDELGAPNGYIVSIRDCSLSKAAEDDAERMARHDPLTGLGNRTLFRERLDQAIASLGDDGTTFALLWMDLDRFKAINDSFGHLLGDRALSIIADRITSVVDPADTVARLGGDEFIILMNKSIPARAEALAQQVMVAVSRPIDLDGQRLCVGVSIGIASLPVESCQADVLLKNADLALYRAKRSGRNTFCWFESAMEATGQARLRMEIEMQAAIRNGGFVLHYQPILDINDGEIHGSEALVRWRHPERGMIPPSDFIPLAEETGLIVPLGDWVLHEACREAAQWPGSPQIAVNVSGCQFTPQGLEARVIAALNASGLDPARLELEITESVLIDDEDTVLKSLVRLRSLGVKIALDDFGTGYSSLSYLRRFQFDRIKIDRSFVNEIASPSAAAIIRAVAGLASEMGIKVTAEGIETPEQLRLVREYGCTHAQGFLFSRPTESHHVRALLARQQSRRQTSAPTWTGPLPDAAVLRETG
ncbi:bifunctional diguanylate cyclase/phosphodiesterase [Beijerinckia sp. L45]|uniref:putative bifunctional diguanylate cyclase/phosphodiesterase n=1 Tax=Beijerinckia sp. L45 TaxID=1641855 RepID=UPI00131B303A|nr:EAL domain-containing protein [Beijerinckia sp. L45]